MESQRGKQRIFSFEFFPPRTPEARGRLQSTWECLSLLKPDFFSVTYGAGGSTCDLTFETAQQIHATTGIVAAPHISCIGSSLDDLRATLERYRNAGVKRIVALRGDMPSGTVGFGELRYANELVAFIRQETGDYFNIEVAAYPEIHPQAPSPSADLENFKRKILAGANGAITQYFYNPYAYYRFVEECEKIGVNAPIVPGIMPIVSCMQLQRFSNACGAEIPQWILKRLHEFGDDRASIRKFGIDVVAGLCSELLSQGAPGLHFYTMNQHIATQSLWKMLNIDDLRSSVIVR
ncbi:MAG: methylenetetrahydrofolate reductase [NAD(P)H] [Candidatus Eutrophobiaceae bacterium]